MGAEYSEWTFLWPFPLVIAIFFIAITLTALYLIFGGQGAEAPEDNSSESIFAELKKLSGQSEVKKEVEKINRDS